MAVTLQRLDGAECGFKKRRGQKGYQITVLVAAAAKLARSAEFLQSKREGEGLKKRSNYSNGGGLFVQRLQTWDGMRSFAPQVLGGRV
jgi:hypothetical protein